MENFELSQPRLLFNGLVFEKEEVYANFLSHIEILGYLGERIARWHDALH